MGDTLLCVFKLSIEKKEVFSLLNASQCTISTKSELCAYSGRSFNVKRHKKDEQNLHRLLLAVAFNYIN